MKHYSLGTEPFVELHKLLQIAGWTESGGLAKRLIAEGNVQVDGQVELRRRCKIRAGQQVEFGGQHIRVTA